MVHFLRGHIPHVHLRRHRDHPANEKHAEPSEPKLTADQPARGSFTGTPLFDSPVSGSLRSSYSSGVGMMNAAPPSLASLSDPNAAVYVPGGPVWLNGERKPAASPLRAVHNENDDKGSVHSSHGGVIGVQPLNSDEMRPLITPQESHPLQSAETPTFSDPFQTPSSAQTPASTQSDPFKTPATTASSAGKVAVPPSIVEHTAPNGGPSPPGDSGSSLQSEYLSAAEYVSGASTPLCRTQSTPLPHTPRSQPASPPDSPPLPAQLDAGSLLSTLDALPRTLRSRPTSMASGQLSPLPSPIEPGTPWGAQRRAEDAYARPASICSTASKSSLHQCHPRHPLLHRRLPRRLKPEAQQSYRPSPASISSTSASSGEGTPIWRGSEDDEEVAVGLKPLVIKADELLLSAGVRSIAWCEELRMFHGPVPAALISGRFPPLELVSSGSDESGISGMFPNGAFGHPVSKSHGSWSSEEWPAPHSLPSKLSLGSILSGRVFTTASGLGGSTNIVKFFLGSETARAQKEARAYEVTADSGVTPKWYGAYGGFHPRVGSGGRKRADQVLVWALVVECVGEEAVLEKLRRKEKRAIVKAYEDLHAAGVLHNTPRPEHWRLDENGMRIVSFTEAMFRDDMHPVEWEDACKAEKLMVHDILSATES